MDALVERVKKYLQSEDYEGILDIPAPATLEEIEAAEQKLGFKLPELLRELYLEVGNGGFGPSYGLLGVGSSGWTDDQGDTVETLSLGVEDPHDPDEYTWPDKLLP